MQHISVHLNQALKEIIIATIFTNGIVSIRKCLVLGLVVLGTDGKWHSLEYMSDADFRMVDRLIDDNPTFPWAYDLAQIRADHAP